MTIAGDGVSGRALAACDATPPQGGLALQGVRDGDGWEETVRGRGRRAHGEASAAAAVGAAARIDRLDTGGGAAERREAEAQGAALLGPACGLGRAHRGGEVVGAPVEQRGETKDPASARRGPPAGEQRGDSRRAVVAGDDTGARLAGPIADVQRCLGEAPCRKRRGGQLFCVARPESARTGPTRRALTVQPLWGRAAAIASRVRAVSNRVRLRRASTSVVRCAGVCGPGRVGRRSAGEPLRTAWRIA